ncbi:MAG: hypothetical protein N3I35_04935 [Clostridia bacterium]|nr:hypothetical protein [Clostridia bacterium]
MNNYNAFLYEGDTLLINEFLILCELDAESFDLFDTKIKDIVNERIDNIHNDYGSYDVFDKTSKFLFNDLSKFESNKIEYFYSEVNSSSRQKVVLDIEFSGIFKIWFNKSILYIGTENRERKKFVLEISEGKNHILIEYVRQNGYNLARGFVQLYNYEDVQKGIVMPKLMDYLLKQGTLVVSKYSEEKHILEFMILDNRGETYDVHYYLYTSQCTIPARLEGMVKYTLDLKGLTAIDNIALFFDKSGERVNLVHIISQEQIDALILRAIEHTSKKDDAVRIQLLGIVEKLKKGYLTNERRFLLAAELQSILENEEYTSNREYYLSEIDNSVLEVNVRKPDDYNEAEQYPLILFLIDKEEVFFSDSVEGYREYFIADFFSGGLLGGGYVSEARILEVLNYIRGKYKIDENRIYLLGQSHSGYDVWTLIENYPDIAAAAYMISGYPYYPNIRNVSNIPIANIVSDRDYSYFDKTDSISKVLSASLYSQTNLHNIIHDALADFNMYPIMEFFHGKVGDPYPRTINFRTERNRYLSSFWISTYGILKSKNYLQVKAEAVSDRLIVVNVENADGFKITLPPHIDKKSFVIAVNEQEFRFSDYSKAEVSFKYCGGKYFEIKQWEEPIDYRKGTGLLDVYLAPLSIFVPRTEIMTELSIAFNFASPLSYSVINSLYVRYPIYYLDELSTSVLKGNLIFINVPDLGFYFDGTVEVPITAYNDHFTYKGENYYGEYCIMQVVPNPADNKYSILLINTNNNALLQRCIFTRKVMLPFMFNGFHDYYNNEGLIMYNKKYYGIYEWDDNLKEI